MSADFKLILFATLLIVGYIGCISQKDYTATPEGKALFERKCSLCHDLDRTTSKRRSYSDWHSTVLNMKNRYSASITDEEAVTISEYLAATYGR